jgi:uncharacterized protein YceH (UPF0502 family)
MNIELSPHEARVLGCLIEKQITTPEQYPLSLNAITNACNQKSNRDPVLDLTDNEIQTVLDALSRKHLVIDRSGFGSRVPKYQQRFCNTEFSVLQFTPQERAIVCELLLRGPQTPGELRTRAARMVEFGDVTQVESALEALAARPSGPMVQKLARQPGRRDSRYAHLFSGAIVESTVDSDAAAVTAVTGRARRDDTAAEPDGEQAHDLRERVSRLESQLQALQLQVTQLAARLP